jgi:hypothetical protein
VVAAASSVVAANTHGTGGLMRWSRCILGPVIRLVAGLAAALAMIVPAASPAHAAQPADVAAEKQWDRCNDISGSPLCLVITGELDGKGHVGVRYHKKSGPVRSIRLYIASCARAKELVYEGNIAPTQLKLGGKWKSLSYSSCWVGYLRIGNTQWTTGEVVTR